MNLAEKYSIYYQKTEINKLYPTEFIVRAFLGSNGISNGNVNYYKQKTVLDLGFGDGRNIPFLSDIGLQVYGLEISQQILRKATQILEKNGYFADLRVGTNYKTNFDSNFFDFILACHSLYYIEQDTSFTQVLEESKRILKDDGKLICSLPDESSYIIKRADKLSGEYARVKDDPLKIRNGMILKYFSSEEVILNYLSKYFSNIKIGRCFNDWWGLNENCWIIICSDSKDHGN